LQFPIFIQFPTRLNGFIRADDSIFNDEDVYTLLVSIYAHV